MPPGGTLAKDLSQNLHSRGLECEGEVQHSSSAKRSLSSGHDPCLSKHRRVSVESGLQNHFAAIDSMIKVKFVAFLQFEAWVLFRLDSAELWVDSEVEFSETLFNQAIIAARHHRLIAQILRWLPRLRRARRVLVWRALSRLRSADLRDLLVNETRRLVLRHDLGEGAAASLAHWESPLGFPHGASRRVHVDGLMARLGDSGDASFDVLTMVLPTSQTALCIHIEEATACDTQEEAIRDLYARHDLEMSMYVLDRPLHRVFPGAMSEFRHLTNILDTAEDARGVVLLVNVQMSGTRTVTVCAEGPDGCELERRSLVCALPAGDVWYFCITINSSPQSSWQIRAIV